jgi:hypothetical protein
MGRMMSRLTPEDLRRRRRAQLGRTIMGVSALLLMIMSAVAPHIMVQAATVVPGRSLIPASHFFLIANPNAEAFSEARSVAHAGMGISLTYLGLALHQIGLITGLASFWVLIVEDVGKWTRRLVMVSGMSLLLSASTVVLGYQFLNQVGVPTLLGFAWLPTLLAGLVMVIGARMARGRQVTTWFWEKPEIVQP